MGSTASKPVQHVGVDSVHNEKALLDDSSKQSSGSPVLPPPVSPDGSLSLKSVAGWEAAASASAKTRLARTVLHHTALNSVLKRREALVADVHVFNTELDFKVGPITNQESSGRCWLFATTNVLRYEIMKKLKLKEFQLSQARGPTVAHILTYPVTRC